MSDNYERSVRVVASDISPEKAAELWREIAGNNLPWPLCALVLSAAKAVGPFTAVKLLQRCLPCAVDGIPSLRMTAAVGKMDLPSLCAMYQAERVLWMMGNRKFDVYGRLWVRELFIMDRGIYDSHQ